MVYASNDPHGPWNRGPTYDPAKLTVPPYLHDNSETRGELAKYYAVRDVRYKLNRNLAPDKTYTIGGIHKGEPIQSWQEDAKHDSKLAARIAWLFNRPAEELYDLDSDPYEMKNLASEPQFASTKARLQKQLDHWIQQQGYKGMETELLANTRQGKSDEDESKGKKAKVKK